MALPTTVAGTAVCPACRRPLDETMDPREVAWLTSREVAGYLGVRLRTLQDVAGRLGAYVEVPYGTQRTRRLHTAEHVELIRAELARPKVGPKRKPP